MQEYRVYVQLREGYYQDVIITADSVLSATYQARAQYGESNVIGMASPNRQYIKIIFLLRKMAVALYGNENVIGVVGQR